MTILREEGFGEDGGSTVGGRGGVVHSFTGTETELAELVSDIFQLYQVLNITDSDGFLH